ncbi:MAG: hypothetical protein AAB521_03295, partial [Patescibacteria group bacterium]
DATGSVKLIVKYIIDAWIEGRQEGIKNDEKNRKIKEVEDAKKASDALKAEKKAISKAVVPKTMDLKDGINEKKFEKPKESTKKKPAVKKVSKAKKTISD